MGVTAKRLFNCKRIKAEKGHPGICRAAVLTVYAWGTKRGTSQFSKGNSIHYNATSNEELNDLSSSPNIVRVTKPRRMR